jgi:imidazole glycerol-phosphate synthase subunit HisH
MTLTVVDYGAGNLTSVVKGLMTTGATVRVVADPSELGEAGALVVPGVGHFAATQALDDRWHQAIHERVDAGVPFLGICLGLQWLFEGSDEAPAARGLGLFSGRCFRLPDDVKVPHVGWNTIDAGGRAFRLLDGLPAGSMAYFTHSFAAPAVAGAAVTTHGARFASAVERGHVFGTQFHPEKSGTAGLRILANFVAFANERR